MEKADFCPHCNFLPHSFSFYHLPSPPPPPPPPALFLASPLPSGHDSLSVWGLMDSFVFQHVCVWIGKRRKDEQRCFSVRCCKDMSAWGSGGRESNQEQPQTKQWRDKDKKKWRFPELQMWELDLREELCLQSVSSSVRLPHVCGCELTRRLARQETQRGPVELSSFFCNNAKEEVARGSFLRGSSSLCRCPDLTPPQGPWT